MHVHQETHHDHQEITAEALLRHMAEHNESHLHELDHVAGELEGDAKAAVAEAMEYYKKGNARLRQAIELL